MGGFFARGPLDYETPSGYDDASAAHIYAQAGCGSGPHNYLEAQRSPNDYAEPFAGGSSGNHQYAWVTPGQGDATYDNVGAKPPGAYDMARPMSADQAYDLAGSAQSGTSHYDVATQRQEVAAPALYDRARGAHGMHLENPAFYDSGAHVPYDTAAACTTPTYDIATALTPDERVYDFATSTTA